MEAFGSENGRGMAGEQQEQFVKHRSEGVEMRELFGLITERLHVGV